MKTIFTEQQIEYMKQNYKTMTYREISSNLGFTERQIRGKINNMNLTKLRNVNDNYFEEINTPLKAYLIGFIYADAWISYNINSRFYEFGIELQSKDRYVLDLINNELGGKNIIKHSNPKQVIINGVVANRGHMDCLRIYSKKIVFSLEKHGIMKNKTNSNIYPIVNESLFFDFLRGYIDGDGCFYKRNNSINMNITCSSMKPLKYIQDKLSAFEIKTCIYKEKDKKYRLVCCNKKSIKKLVNYLYYEDNLFCLKRKYEIVKSLINGSAV